MVIDATLIYYIETNLIAIIMAIVLFVQQRRISSKNETSQIILSLMIIFMMVFSISDIFAYVSRGNSLVGVHISNMVYFLMMCFGSYTWFMYIAVKMEYFKDVKKLLLYTGTPMVLLTIAILLNPVHGFFFTVDASNLYQRGTGLYITWVVEWGYMISATVMNIIAAAKERRDYKRSEYIGYVFFVLPVLLAAAIQMVFYGTTITQVGFMLALFMAYINRASHQSQKDGLTGLNNKNAFLSYRDSLVNRGREASLTLLIMDADDFKSINDKHGHLKGDQALKDIANVLEASVKEITHKRLALYRYAGDEFVIVGNNLEEDDISLLRTSIDSHLVEANASNKEKGEQYKLSLSLGASTRTCSSESEFDQLLVEADENMYTVKSKKPHRARK